MLKFVFVSLWLTYCWSLSVLYYKSLSKSDDSFGQSEIVINSYFYVFNVSELNMVKKLCKSWTSELTMSCMNWWQKKLKLRLSTMNWTKLLNCLLETIKLSNSVLRFGLRQLLPQIIFTQKLVFLTSEKCFDHVNTLNLL